MARVKMWSPLIRAAQTSASAPAGGVLRVMNRASHSRRTVSADRQALLLSITRRRSTRFASRTASSAASPPPVEAVLAGLWE